MKRLLIVTAGVVLGAAIFVVGALALVWLFADNTIQFSIRNDSGVFLQNVTILTPDSQSPPPPADMEPGVMSAFNTGDSLKPRISFPVRIVFDAARRHYEVPQQLQFAPLGSYYVSFRIDDHMHVSCTTKFL